MRRDRWPQEGQERTFNHFMQLFVLPEITRRKESGTVAGEFVLRAAQVLFPDDGKQPIVRLNDEVKMVARVKLKKGAKKEQGAAMLRDEIESLENLRLTDEEEPEHAHVSMVNLGDHWVLGFDFRYNKRLAREHYVAGRQFYESAQNNHHNGLKRPFIDNLFSCIELLAKAELLLMPDEKLKKKPRHKRIQIKYNNFVEIGNAKLDFRTALNKLSGLRGPARYLKSNFDLSETEAQEFLSTAKEMIDYLLARLEEF